MMEFRFSVRDALSIRFAVSPLVELIGSLRVLAGAEAGYLHRGWKRSMLGSHEALVSAEIAALVQGRYVPEVLTAPSHEAFPSLELELECINHLPAGALRRSLEDAFPHRIPHALRQLHRDASPEALRRITRQLAAYWEGALAPAWPRTEQLLRDDIYARLRQIETAGLAGMLSEIHPGVLIGEKSLRVSHWHTARRALDGQGLLLIPSAFGWPRLHTISDPPLQPALIYPALGAATMWEPARESGNGMAAALGPTRFQILAMLSTPRSGKELAASLGITQSAVSQQITVLRTAHLVRTFRAGRSTLAVRTPLGDTIANAG